MSSGRSYLYNSNYAWSLILNQPEHNSWTQSRPDLMYLQPKTITTKKELYQPLWRLPGISSRWLRVYRGWQSGPERPDHAEQKTEVWRQNRSGQTKPDCVRLEREELVKWIKWPRIPCWQGFPTTGKGSNSTFCSGKLDFDVGTFWEIIWKQMPHFQKQKLQWVSLQKIQSFTTSPTKLLG